MNANQKKGALAGLLSAVITLVVLVLGFGLVGTTGTANASGTLTGTDGNDNPVLGEVQSWTDLKKAVEGKEDWYKKCLQGRNGITWTQVNQYSALEGKGNDLRVVLVSNADISDATARQLLKDKGTKDVDNLPVIRVNGFTNTFGLPSDRCKAGWDDRSQVRLALGVPNDVTNLSKGFRKDKGVLAMCGNPWDVPPGGHKPPSSTPTPTPTPTKKPCVKPSKPGDGKYVYNPDNCTWRKPGQSFDEQQNGDTGVRQDPQDNTTSGVDTGPTKDDKGVPIPEPTKKPTPPPGNPTPDPTPGGYDTGSNTGGGGNPTTPPEDSGQGGDNTGDGGGFP